MSKLRAAAVFSWTPARSKLRWEETEDGHPIPGPRRRTPSRNQQGPTRREPTPNDQQGRPRNDQEGAPPPARRAQLFMQVRSPVCTLPLGRPSCLALSCGGRPARARCEWLARAAFLENKGAVLWAKNKHRTSRAQYHAKYNLSENMATATRTIGMAVRHESDERKPTWGHEHELDCGVTPPVDRGNDCQGESP